MATIKFTRNVQPLKCEYCGKVTTDYDMSTLCLAPDMKTKVCVCMPCFNAAGIENEHADGYHKDAPCAECPECNADIANNATTTKRPKAQKEPAMSKPETNDAAPNEIDALVAAAKVAAEAHKAAIDALMEAKAALAAAKEAAMTANAALREARAAKSAA